MGLFKDFKEDFSQAVNEMMPGADIPEQNEKSEDLVVNTIGENVDVKSELSKLDGLLEKVKNEGNTEVKTQELEAELPPIRKEEPKPAEVVKPEAKPIFTPQEERRTMSDTVMTQNKINSAAVTDETSVITAGTVLTGDIASDGSFDIQGTINGNVTCNGKLVVTGTINGNSAATEIFADVAKIEGEVVSSGTVKIGAGSVIIGNISASSAVIAGAIKGDIDVQGPVVVDTSAVVMGNIKSRSVQINNGAVIEGFCSQCYAEIDVQGLFDGK
jgi:cytoskeletal protein CcmA (bactofilin family)